MGNLKVVLLDAEETGKSDDTFLAVDEDIRRLSRSCSRVSNNIWLLVSDKTEREVFKILEVHMGDRDCLLVGNVDPLLVRAEGNPDLLGRFEYGKCKGGN